MKPTTSDFEYDLPPERIAQRPCDPRDQSRLMVLLREDGQAAHHVFTDLPGAELFRRGDANGDGAVNMADAMTMCAQFFRGASVPCQDAIDVNDDGRLTQADILFLLGYLFCGTEAPRSPGPHLTWYDPTQDGLDCETGTP